MTETDAPVSDGDKKLFWACIIALIATAFGFIVRAMVIDDWAAEFQLTETQKGEIFGVGLWPFAISIVLFSLIIDRIGYDALGTVAFDPTREMLERLPFATEVKLARNDRCELPDNIRRSPSSELLNPLG